jgi:hypothetical protein
MRIYIGNRVHPGTVGLHIQARPPAWLAQAAVGSVPILKPSGGMVQMMERLVADRKAGKPADFTLFQGYRIAYDAQLRAADLRPGSLLDAAGVPVPEDVTLICTCAREEAKAGKCHREWAAFWLDRAGWEVYCDWLEVKP